MALKDNFKKAVIGQQIIIEVTDPGFISDVTAWCNVTKNKLVSLNQSDNIITAVIIKQSEIGEIDDTRLNAKEDILTMIIFSEEMDKALAAFNIALGALAMGMKVKIFFTFWGLSLLRIKDLKTKHKNFLDKMAGNMFPKSDKDEPLSHHNMGGLGAKMMSDMMKKKNIPPLDFMLHLSKMEGAEFIACQMSMSMMGIEKGELIEGITIGGVATMLEYAKISNLNYFI